MTDPPLKIVVESPTAAELVRAIIGTELARRVRFFVTRGEISPASLGRNILVHEGGPVLVVQDADTTNRQLADEQQGFVRLALARVGTEDDFEVFFFLPEIEVVLFEAPSALNTVLHQNVPADTVREGMAQPRRTWDAIRKQSSPCMGSGVPIHTIPDIGDTLAAGAQAQAFKNTVERFATHDAPV